MKRAMVLTQVGPVGATREAQAREALISVAVPAATSSEYYRTVESPHSFAMIEVFESPGQVASTTPAVLAQSGLGFARHVCAEVADDVKSRAAAPILMIVAFCVPPERCAEVDEWYEFEHAPLLLKAPGWLRARRHHTLISDGTARWTHIALHDLRDLETLDSNERTFARSTEWRARLTQENWFEQAGRWVYERIALENLS